MPIGTSDGEYYDDHFDYLANAKKKSDAAEMAANETSGDFRSRFGGAEERPLVYIKTPVEAPEKPTDALKSSGGSNLPDIDDVLKQQDELPQPTPNTVISGTNSTTGRPINITDKDLDQGMGLGMSFSGGGLTFKGVKSPTFNRAALNAAQDLEGQGVHPDDIWHQTNTFRGADGRWRQEIDDSKAAVNMQALQGDGLSELPNVLNHPELYKAYPDMKKILVAKLPDKEAETSLGKYDPNVGLIYLNQNMSSKETKEILLHELQHHIQSTEGFATGSSVSQFLPPRFEEAKQLYFSMLEHPNADPSHPDIMKAKALINKVYAEAYEKYSRVMGEVESRNVEQRANYSRLDRRSMPPVRTEEVPRFLQTDADEGLITPLSAKPPTTFRRAANDNIPQTREAMKKRMSDIIDQLRDMHKETLRFTPEQQKKWDALNAEHHSLFEKLMQDEPDPTPPKSPLGPRNRHRY